MSYRSVMLEDLPNLAFTFGYTNASWTLKADITSEWICRVLKHMDRIGARRVVPVNHDPSIVRSAYLDFTSGYIQRSLHKFPKMGNRAPWKLKQLYPYDLMMLRYSRLEDGVLEFSRPAAEAELAAVKTG
jgi:hypothetical protein